MVITLVIASSSHLFSSCTSPPVIINGSHWKRRAAGQVSCPDVSAVLVIEGLTSPYRNMATQDRDMATQDRDMAAQDTRKTRNADPGLQPVNYDNVSDAEASIRSQQSSSGGPTLSTRLTTHTPTNGAATGSSESERLPTDGLIGRRSNTRDHELLGIGAQFSGAGNTQRAPSVTGANLRVRCPFHGQIAPDCTRSSLAGGGLHPMDRYLAEGPLEQSAFFRRPDTGELSIHKRCRCNEIVHHSVVGNGSRRG